MDFSMPVLAISKEPTKKNSKKKSRSPPKNTDIYGPKKAIMGGAVDLRKKKQMQPRESDNSALLAVQQTRNEFKKFKS